MLAYLALCLLVYGVLYYGQWRYRLPMEPFMILVASPLLVRVGHAARELAGRSARHSARRRRLHRRLTWLRRHPAAAAALVYAVLSVLLYAPALIPGHTLSASDYLWGGAPWQGSAPAGVGGLGSNYEEADAVLVFQPFTQWARGELPGAPLWNPHIMAGRPFVANAQSALFSPFTWPALVLPFWWSLGIVAALKLFVAAMGTFLLARALAVSWAGAVLAGIVFAFSLSFVVWLSWPLSSVWAWLPWLWLGVWEVARRPGALPVAGLALVVALQFFGGHPESSFHSLAASALFALLALSRSDDRWRAVGRLVIGVVAGAALAAVALLPFVELLFHSNDLTTREGREFLTLEPRFLLGFFLPDYWGQPSGAQIDAFAGGARVLRRRAAADAGRVGAAVGARASGWRSPVFAVLAAGGGGGRAGGQAGRDAPAGLRHRRQHLA